MIDIFNVVEMIQYNGLEAKQRTKLLKIILEYAMTVPYETALIGMSQIINKHHRTRIDTK